MRSPKLQDNLNVDLHVRLSQDQFNYINRYCSKNHITSSQFIRMVINNLIYREESKKSK